MSNTGRWYAIHTVINMEEKVKEALIKDNIVHNVIIPVETEIKVDKKGKEKTKKVKIFPGYVFVNAEMTPKIWHKIQNIYGVISFLSPALTPPPLDGDEVKKLGIF